MSLSHSSPLLDPRRVAAVRATGLLDGTPVPALDRLTRLAARVADAPVALLSLLDDERAVVVAAFGAQPHELPASESLCRHVVERGEPVVLHDEGGVAAYAGVPLRDAGGCVLGALCVTDDVPRAWPAGLVADLEDVAAAVLTALDLREHARTLSARETQLRTVVGSAPLVLGAMGADGVYTLFEGRGLEQLGIDPDQVVGRHFREVWADAPALALAAERALAGESFSEELELGGRVFDAVIEGLDADAGPGATTTVVAVDVTERRRDERQLEHLALHDRLTGLANRQLLEDRLRHALACRRLDGGTAGLLFVDLDQFKLVNDSLGHGAGDELLRQAAERLSAVTRHNDLVARHGGDEFMVLLDDLGPDPLGSAERIAAKLQGALQPPFTVGDASFEIGASIGISLYPRDGEYGEELLRKADAAMYQAKKAGRNASLAYESSQEDVRQRLTLTARLRRALARDEFLLHFQPLWDLRSREIVGVESLIRWEDPELGLIPPLTFIAHAEEHGLIDRIGDWVIDAACAQSASWAREGLTPSVAFNVAPRQLQRSGFVTDLADTAARHDVDPRGLTVEITESAAMADPETTERVLHDLAELGPLVSIDDFGAGHSSLGRLRSLRVSGLKLDRSFLHGVPADPGAGSIIGGVLSLTSSLGLTAIAEGIETEAQLAFLVEAGCRYGQGFHLSRPLEAVRATALLHAAAAPPTR